jgi:hypothetical protein
MFKQVEEDHNTFALQVQSEQRGRMFANRRLVKAEQTYMMGAAGQNNYVIS